MEFSNMDNALMIEVMDAEDDIMNDITGSINKLIRLQREKKRLRKSNIDPKLLNENCFPEMAEIWSKTNKENKSLDVIICSDSALDSEESLIWDGTWSSD